MSKIIYEPHPVSPERKAELVSQGFKIIDAVFAPADAEEGSDDKSDAEETPKTKARRAPRKEAEN